MKRTLAVGGWMAAVMACWLGSAFGQNITKVCDLPSGMGGGSAGALAISSGTIYGMTDSGGSSWAGTIFSVSTAGTGFQEIFDFSSNPAYSTYGASPHGGLTVQGSTLYGMTMMENTARGTIFSVNTNGGGFNILHTFIGSDGLQPQDTTLALSGTTLYGMAIAANGVVFQMDANGTGYKLLHSFVGSDGSWCNGSLTVLGTTLYGMTQNGGSNENGVAFSMDATDTNSFQVLHRFVGGTTDGSQPEGSLTLAGSHLFGMTSQGGASDFGTIFMMNTDGTGYQVLHSFAGGANDGASPWGDATLTLAGSQLYGVTAQGGVSNSGTFFMLNSDGTGYINLDSFTDSSTGILPGGPLVLDGSKLYGRTLSGGANYGGTVFSADVIPEPGSLTLLALAGAATAFWRRTRRRREPGK